MRIFLFFTLSLLVYGCSTVKVTKEVIKVTSTVTDQVKKSIPKNENEKKTVIEEIEEDIKIEEEIEIIEEKQEEEKNIIETQQKLAEINFIGSSENKIIKLLGHAQLKRIDGSLYILRYDSYKCRLFLFFKEISKNKKVEYFELRNNKGELLNSKQALEQCL